MNLQWGHDYYQPWSDNEWLVEEMLVLMDKGDRCSNASLKVWNHKQAKDSSDKLLLYL